MAAISANLLAAVAPPVNPPAPSNPEPTPPSGFANVLSQTVNRPQKPTDTSKPAAADTTTPAKPDEDEKTATDTTATTATQAVAAVIAAVAPPVQPILVAATTATTTATATVTTATTTVPTAAPAVTTNQLASRAEQLKLLNTSNGQTATTTTNLPAATTPPAVATPTEAVPATQQPVPQTQTTPTPQPLPGTAATTPGETAAVAARPPVVAPQVPVVADRGQQLPAQPPEIGYGLVGPTVAGTPPVKPVTPAGAGPSQARMDLTATGLPKATEAATAGMPTTAQPATSTFAGVLNAQEKLPVTPDSDAKADSTAAVVVPAGAASVPQPDVATVASTGPASAANPAVAPQLSDAFVTHARVIEHAGTHEFQIRLDPPELGEVKVRVLAMGDRVEARLVVSDDAVKRLIESQLPELRQRLEAAGVSVPKFDVTTGGDGRANQDANQGGWDRAQAAAPSPVRPAAPPHPARTPSSGGLIDVTA